MSKTRTRRVRKVLVLGGRMNTGAVQFNNDWPGLFLRGDTAIVMAFHIRELEKALSDTSAPTVSSAVGYLIPLAEIVEREVTVQTLAIPAKDAPGSDFRQ